jgi:preprotein translocase subunit SecG
MSTTTIILILLFFVILGCLSNKKSNRQSQDNRHFPLGKDGPFRWGNEWFSSYEEFEKWDSDEPGNIKKTNQNDINQGCGYVTIFFI